MLLRFFSELLLFECSKIFDAGVRVEIENEVLHIPNGLETLYEWHHCSKANLQPD